MTDLITRHRDDVKGNTVLLLHEALARSRMREAETAARDHRLVRIATAGRGWRRLARFAQERADRATADDLHLPARR